VLLLTWSGWFAYTCFKRAVKPPKDRISRLGYNEVEALNREPIVRVLIAVGGLLILAIGVDVALSKTKNSAACWRQIAITLKTPVRVQ
jgi:hypothetical protein